MYCSNALFFDRLPLSECVAALGVSFFVNFSIVSVSAVTFYYDSDAGLANAPATLKLLGDAAPYVFGVALLASGQSSTITGTYAGQFVMEVRTAIFCVVLCSCHSTNAIRVS